MHEEQFPAVTLSFNLAPGASLGDAVAAMSAAESDIGMPTTVIGSYSGDAAEFASSLAGEPWLILAAAVTIYIVLGMLYESFVHPLTILSTLPSAGVGALLALMWFRQDLSIVALIGIVLLMGIVKKNAIMMTDSARRERNDGLAPRRGYRCLPAAVPPDHDDDAAALSAPASSSKPAPARAAFPLGSPSSAAAVEPVAHALQRGDLSAGPRP
jgi:multidrug efflux pump